MTPFPNILESLRASAAHGARGIRFVEGAGSERHVTYAQLRANALSLLARWREAGVRPGDELIVQLDDLESYLTAFWAALLGRVIAVPIAAGTSEEPMRRLTAVRSRLTNAWLATSRDDGEARTLVVTRDFGSDACDVDDDVDPDAIAFLQFSSGSTATPKGVIVTHRMLTANTADICLHAGVRADDAFLSWIPLTHDLGLIGFHLLAIVCSVEQIVMPTSLFIRRPLLWMEKVSQHRATFLYSPNFGYHYFLGALRRDAEVSWDLSHVRVIFNGAEPISPSLCRRFVRALAPYGLRSDTVVPVYGLAEATLSVTQPEDAAEARTYVLSRAAIANGEGGAAARRLVDDERAQSDDAIEMVETGSAVSHVQLRIADDADAPLPERRIGRILISGPSVTPGYYNDPDATADAIRDGWLDTGDLGFLDEGRLVVTGRRKELIILNGANYYPQDLEQLAHRVDGIGLGEVAAASIRGDARERLVFFVRHKGSADAFAPIADAIRAEVGKATGLVVDDVVAVPRIPKTTSGKPQRLRLAAEYEASLRPAQTRRDTRPLLEELQTIVRSMLGVAVDADRPLREFGLSSLQAVELAQRARELTGREVAVSLAFDYPTLRAIARHLEGETQQRAITSSEAGERIAIIGAGLRFPGNITDLESLRRALATRFDAVTEVPRERFDAEKFFDADARPGTTYTRWGSFVDDVELFDHRFFSIAPVEAEALDPQQRLLLEVSWEALEQAGQVPERLRESATGVFVGISNTDYASRHIRSGDARRITGYALTGASLATAAGRLSYVHGFQGPCLAVDTACSSSLVAVHLAAQSLRAGECSMAIAGGVNLILGPEVHIGFSQLHAMAADGRCKVFDASADGYVRGEGCALVVLKRLADAERDGDPILAVLRGSAVNQDGASNGLTAPNGLAQQQVIRAALRNAGVTASDVSYVEAHGTGTPLGDPQELEALAAVYDADRESPLWVGSLKANLGHLEAAAGVAGLLKAVLAVRDGEVAPNLHFDHPTPHFGWDAHRLRVATEAATIDAPVRRAAVSSFGFSGTNAHAIVESHSAPRANTFAPPHTLLLTAKSPQALDAMRSRFIEALRGDVDAGAICATAARRRQHHPWRLAVAGDSAEELIAELQAATLPAMQVSSEPVKAVFVFPGQGGQWNGMGRELFESEPLFRETIGRCDAAFRAYVDWSLADAIRSGFDCTTGIDRVQPALFAIGLGLARMWRARGVEPYAVIGHSMGEVAAAHLAGILSLDDAARVICRRSQIIRTTSGHGLMLAVELSADAAAEAIGHVADRVCVAVINSRDTTVLSGDAEAIEELMRGFEARGVFCRRIHVDVASHSPQMDALRPLLDSALRGLTPAAPTLRMHSTVLDRVITTERLDETYWVRNLREPVRFASAIESLIADGARLFVEMSPHPILTAAVPATAVGSLRRDESETLSFARHVAVAASVAPIDWSAIYPDVTPVPLPAYAWQRERFWLDEAKHVEESVHPFLVRSLEDLSTGARLWDAEIDVERAPWLADHRVGDAIVFPAAGWIELVVAATGAHELSIEFREPLVLTESHRVQLRLDGDGSFSLQSGATLHVRGRVLATSRGRVAERALPHVPASSADHYRRLDLAGLHYGPAFQTVETLGDDGVLAHATLRAKNDALDRRHAFDPALLDGALQTLLPQRQLLAGPRVPVAIESLIVDAQSLRGELLVETDLSRGDIVVATQEGVIALDARGVRLAELERGTRDAASLLYELQWQEVERASLRSSHGPSPGASRHPLPASGARGNGGAGDARAGGAASEDTRQVSLLPAMRGEGARRADEGRFTLAEDHDTRRWVAPRSDDAAATVDAFLSFARTLIETSATQRLLVITRGAFAINNERVDPVHAAIAAAARTLAHEHPELAPLCIDLPYEPTDADREVAESHETSSELELAIRNGRAYAPRLARAGESRATSATTAARFVATVPHPGALDRIVLRATRAPRLARDEVEVAVHATGLNFLNVLSALGEYPGYPNGFKSLGIEMSGVVVRTGPGVHGLQPGDEVLGLADDALASHAVTRASLLVRKPAALSFETAAAIPAAYLTAAFALRDVARIARGERVLIHAATGGVGQAAIAIARAAGAEILATAGSDAKREFLRALGIAQVFDSRSPEFAQAIGEVDVVLGAVTGAVRAASLSLLRSFGRYLEIGKRGAGESLRQPASNVSIHTIDLDALAQRRPELLREMLAGLVDEIARGVLPLPAVQTFDASQISDAFALLARGGHTGKLVVTSRNAARIEPEEGIGPLIEENATYLVTGGTGAIGSAIAARLALRGARHIVLASRKAGSGEIAKRIANADVREIACDASDPAACARLLQIIDDELPPLR
nr:SDR family NAD(P)-dependent oxidoreductase [Acidobacteriota bacterium]